MADKVPHPCPGNAPRKLTDYLAYPRVLLTLILCSLVFLMHIVYGIYVLFF